MKKPEKVDTFPDIDDEKLLIEIKNEAFRIYEELVFKHPLAGSSFNKNMTFSTLQIALTFYIANHVSSEKWPMALQVIQNTIKSNLDVIVIDFPDLVKLLDQQKMRDENETQS